MTKGDQSMKRVCCLICAGLMLSGCSTTTSDRSVTTAQGAGLGAALGAGLGALIGSASDNAGSGALIGALVGGAGGALYGNHVANKKSEYASQEEYLDACLAQANQVYEAAQAKKEGLQTEIATLNEEATRLMEARAAEAAGQADLLALQGRVNASLSEAQQELQQVTDEILIQRQVVENESGSADSDKLAELDAQIGLLEQQKEELSQQTDRLAAINSRISV
jgi:ElaB/YqjD/DUF883 family membrane-anchored ribosome-binding protein